MQPHNIDDEVGKVFHLTCELPSVIVDVYPSTPLTTIKAQHSLEE